MLCSDLKEGSSGGNPTEEKSQDLGESKLKGASKGTRHSLCSPKRRESTGDKEEREKGMEERGRLSSEEYSGGNDGKISRDIGGESAGKGLGREIKRNQNACVYIKQVRAFRNT